MHLCHTWVHTCKHATGLLFWRTLTDGIMVPDKKPNLLQIDTWEKRALSRRYWGLGSCVTLQLDRQSQATSPLLACTTDFERRLYSRTWTWACRMQRGPSCHSPTWTHSEPLTHCHILQGGIHSMTAICQRQVTAAPCPHPHTPTLSPVVILEVSQEFQELFHSQFMFQKEVNSLQRHNSYAAYLCGVCVCCEDVCETWASVQCGACEVECVMGGI